MNPHSLLRPDAPDWMEEDIKYLNRYRNNCSMYAVYEVVSHTAARVADQCIRNGYSLSGMNTFEIVRTANELGGKCVQAFARHSQNEIGGVVTLRMFCERFREGTYLVFVHSHVLVVRDGRVIDPMRRARDPKRHVHSAYRVTMPGSAKFRPARDREKRAIPYYSPDARHYHRERVRAWRERKADMAAGKTPGIKVRRTTKFDMEDKDTW